MLMHQSRPRKTRLGMAARLRDVMTPDPACCTRADTAQQAAQIMKDLDVGLVPVIEEAASRTLLGVVTDRDLCLAVVAAGREAGAVPLRACMSAPAVTGSPEEDVERALSLMEQYQIRRLPIVDAAHQLVGVVALADVLRRSRPPAEQTRQTLEKISAPN